MKQIAQTYRSGDLKLIEVPVPALQNGGVLVQSHYSAISVGTEGLKVRTARQSLLGKARTRPDLVRQILSVYKKEGAASTFRKVMNRLDSPVPLGYSLAGEVVQVAPDVDEFNVGDAVACGGAGYANHAEFTFVPKNLCVKVPEGVPLDQACFTTIGSIALHAVRQGGVQVGESVAVIGLGLVGMLALQILTTTGCRVLGVDLDPRRVSLGRSLGASMSMKPDDPGFEQAVLKLTSSLGIDCVLVTAADPSSQAIHLATRIARDRGRIVVVGIVGLDLDHRLFYEKELELRMSRSYGPGRYDSRYELEGIDYPAGYVRWTENRNMKAFLDLLATKQVNLSPLITHRFAFERAAEAYSLVAGPAARDVIGMVFEYPREPSRRSSAVKLVSPQRDKLEEPVRLGFIGAGNFAKSVLLPQLFGRKDVRLRGVVAATSLSAHHTAACFGFAFASTSARDVFEDPDTDLVLVATRHDVHAKLALAALACGKAVFVEKPLALNESELRDIMEAHRKSPKPFLHVGFNRRFAPMVAQARSFLPQQGPYSIVYRVNAGLLPREHWYHDPGQGGGRLIGEGCHFVDLMHFLTGAAPIEVHAAAMDDAGTYQHDNVFLTVRFSDGSIGSLAYLACGGDSVSKERIEISAGSRTAIIDDFRTLQLCGAGRITRVKSRFHQDKGHAAEMIEVIKALKSGSPAPVPGEDLFLSTLATFAAHRSLQSGRPATIDLQNLL